MWLSALPRVIEREHPLIWVVQGIEAGDQTKPVQKRILGGALVPQESRGARGPMSRLGSACRCSIRGPRGAAHAALDVGCGEALECAVAPQAPNIADIADLECRQGGVIGEAGIHAHQPHLAQVALGLVDDRGDPGRRIGGWMSPTLAR